MTDIEKACKHRCATRPCEHICEYAALYVAGMEAGRKEFANEQLKAEKVDQIMKENRTLKKIMLFTLSKYDLCGLCEIKGQNLPRCTSNTDKDCLKNILCLWETEK